MSDIDANAAGCACRLHLWSKLWEIRCDGRNYRSMIDFILKLLEIGLCRVQLLPRAQQFSCIEKAARMRFYACENGFHIQEMIYAIMRLVLQRDIRLVAAHAVGDQKAHRRQHTRQYNSQYNQRNNAAAL